MRLLHNSVVLSIFHVFPTIKVSITKSCRELLVFNLPNAIIAYLSCAPDALRLEAGVKIGGKTDKK